MDNLEDLVKLLQGNTPEEINSTLRSWEESAGGVGKAVSKMESTIKTATEKAATATKDMAQAAKNSLNDIDISFTNFSDTISSTLTNLNNFGVDFGKTALKMAEVAGSMYASAKLLNQLPEPKIFSALSADLKDAGGYTASLEDGINDLAKTLGRPVDDPFVKILSINAKAVDNIKAAEQGFIQMAGASGQLNDILGGTGDKFTNLESKLNEYKKLVTDTADASGMSVSQTQKWANELLKIPGAIDATIDPTTNSSQQYKTLDAAIKTAAGTGLQFADVFGTINSMYRRFGDERGEGFKRSLEYISQLSEASNNLKMPLEFVKSYADSAADSFKYFGNNAQGAINILNRLGPALQESGLGPEAIEEVTKSVTDNIARMNLASRTFLSAQTGGAGGLAGGYQIELLKQQGKIDQIEQMAESALKKQFGGRVVTLQQAAQDEGAARQLAKQVQLVTTGPTKLVDTEAQAYKLFDAMSKGLSTKGITSPDKTLNVAIDRGSKLQEQNNTILNKHRVLLENIAASTSAMANNTVRGVFGAGEGRGEKALMLRTQMQEAKTSAAGRSIFGQGLLPQTTSEEDFAEFLNSAGTNIKDIAKTFETQGISGIGKNIMSNIGQYADIEDEDLSFVNAAKTALSPNTIVERSLPQKVNKTGAEGRGTEATIHIKGICEHCNAKLAEEVAIKVVDGRIIQENKGRILHNHIGHNSGQ